MFPNYDEIMYVWACVGVCGRVLACAGVCGRVRACAGMFWELGETSPTCTISLHRPHESMLSRGQKLDTFFVCNKHYFKSTSSSGNILLQHLEKPVFIYLNFIKFYFTTASFQHAM